MESNVSTTDFENKFSECKAGFDAIFQLTTAASKIIDSNLKILKVNRALTELLGYSDNELVGTRIMDYACEEDKQHWHELQDAMWHQGKPNFQLDACIKKKDGSLAWVHVTTIVFKEDDIPYAYTILDDFTDWKKLQESEQRLSMALKYSNLAVWELDLTDRSISRSDGFDQLFGEPVTEKGWDEENFLAMFLPEDRLKLKEMLDMISPERQLDFQGCIRTASGTIKWINLQGRAERTPDGKVRILGTLYDITRDKLAEKEKEDFITIASHELKTPLTSLKGSLQLLEKMKDAPTPKMPALLEQASKGMDRVTVLVDDLLNASRMSEGQQLHLRKTRFNLSTAIDECCLHIAAAGTHHILTEGIQDLEVEADAERIQRVIANFVNNAVRYASRSKDIVIRIEQEPEQVRVSVIDSGPGIAADKIPHLFERFYRANECGEQYAGLGLGLYISAEIIKKHGGQIGVDSAPGKGSTFWFTLPAPG
ncbi:ATP-binding protein [Mucilaginibacter litoreus]|uniref:histidine kinase n=1 Tax=Mucilaginibacter litoreus TaxID=1048221 RepID=A0ABW3AY93_9SPHI